MTKAEDRVQRRAQLVAHPREELALGAVGPLSLLLRVAQELITAFALRDVFRDPEQILSFALLVDNGHLLGVQVAHPVVSRLDRLFGNVERDTARERRSILGHRRLCLTCGEDVVGVLPEQLCSGVAEQLLTRPVEANEPQITRIPDQQHVGHVLQHGVEEHPKRPSSAA